MAWHVILWSIGYIDVPNNGIEQACSWASCDIHVHLVLIYTSAFSNVLLVLAFNFTVHESSYCKCSFAWCQVRTFLLFTIWTHPLQMREYLLRYAGTDRNKKSHYNMHSVSERHGVSVRIYFLHYYPYTIHLSHKWLEKFWGYSELKRTQYIVCMHSGDHIWNWKCSVFIKLSMNANILDDRKFLRIS